MCLVYSSVWVVRAEECGVGRTIEFGGPPDEGTDEAVDSSVEVEELDLAVGSPAEVSPVE